MDPEGPRRQVGAGPRPGGRGRTRRADRGFQPGGRKAGSWFRPGCRGQGAGRSEVPARTLCYSPIGWPGARHSPRLILTTVLGAEGHRPLHTEVAGWGCVVYPGEGKGLA